MGGINPPKPVHGTKTTISALDAQLSAIFFEAYADYLQAVVYFDKAILEERKESLLTERTAFVRALENLSKSLDKIDLCTMYLHEYQQSVTNPRTPKSYLEKFRNWQTKPTSEILLGAQSLEATADILSRKGLNGALTELQEKVQSVRKAVVQLYESLQSADEYCQAGRLDKFISLEDLAIKTQFEQVFWRWTDAALLFTAVASTAKEIYKQEGGW